MNPKLLAKIESMSVAEIYFQMYTDTVTGIQNRRAFEDRQPHNAIAIVDMDSLKYVNDTHGHRTGDDYLTKLAIDLVDVFGFDSVFRLSGDEFVVIGDDANHLAGVLRILQRKNVTFSFGAAATLLAADGKLISNKAWRESVGKRSPRGTNPPWSIEVKHD